MLKHIFILLLASTLFVACKKEKKPETETPQPGPAFQIPNTVGSYWIYKWYTIDASGNSVETNLTDTIRIVGDSLINGHTYITYEGGFLGGEPTRWCQRDSLGYVINGEGNIVYSYRNVAEEVYTSEMSPFSIRYSIGTNSAVTVPAGSFPDAATMIMMVSKIDQSPVNTCGDMEVPLYTNYVSGIGMVRRETAYFSELQSQCKKKSSHLIEYYIAP